MPRFRAHFPAATLISSLANRAGKYGRFRVAFPRWELPIPLTMLRSRISLRDVSGLPAKVPLCDSGMDVPALCCQVMRVALAIMEGPPCREED
jgi:hypothetical protein